MRVVLCVLVVCLAATGCGLMRQSMDIDYNDQRLNDGLERVLATGSPAPLRDFTSWEWDEVHLFHEWTERTFIEERAQIEKGDKSDIDQNVHFEQRRHILPRLIEEELAGLST